MNWKTKCLAFHLFARLPGGRRLHSFMQRHVTRSFFLEVTDEVLSSYDFHLKNFRKLTTAGCALEIGAGTNLLLPLLLRKEGATQIYAFDLNRLATVEQVNHVILQLGKRFSREGEWPTVDNLEDDLTKKYYIIYRAPADARRTGLPPNSIDFIYTTSVLEHIPEEEIEPILTECRRIATSDAIMSHNIGYIDHYAHSDSSISYFNFYKYSDSKWRFFNPPNQFQNRLRHCDFEGIFKRFGFRIVENERVMATPKEKEPAVALCSKFQGYSEDDLFTHDGLFTLRDSFSG